MPGDTAQAARLYRAGMDAYGRKQYEEALRGFDRAISLGDRSWKVLDAKAAAMNKMGGPWRTAAFDVAAGLCRQHGKKNYRTWYRMATILVALGMVDAAERSITKGLALSPDAAGRKVLLDVREQGKRLRERLEARRIISAVEAEAEAKARMCFTHLLTPDVLFLIAKHGMAADADTALRMAGVCREWRGIMLAHTQLWSHVRLTKLRPLNKLSLWLERSDGRLRHLTLAPTVPDSATVHHHIAQMLLPHTPALETLDIQSPGANTYSEVWAGRCRALRTLRVSSGMDNSMPYLLRVLAPDAVALESAEFAIAPALDHAPYLTFSFLGVDHPGRGDNPWMPAESMPALRRLRIGRGSVAEARAWLPALLERTPALRELELGCRFAAIYNDPQETVLTLPNLTRLELRDDGGMARPTTTLRLPSLKHYATWDAMRVDTLATLRGPGMPLRTLVSLDIGRCAIAQADLLALLPDLPSLRFLNVSFCGFDNNFLEALVVVPGRPTLVPSLTALSIAGHDSITSSPLQRLVLSRLGEVVRAQPAQAVPRRSAFAPARSAFAPAKPRPKPKLDPTPTPTPSVSTPPSTPPAPITWICVDQCNNHGMDVSVLEALRGRVRFLSNSPGRLVVDRVRGRGAYAWDTAVPASSVPGSGGCNGVATGCELRKRRADGDAWYVHHTCKRAHTE